VLLLMVLLLLLPLLMLLLLMLLLQVPFEANEQDLWQLFGPIGEIVELVVLRHPGSGKSRGCAFVTYVAKECAQMAIDTIHEQQALPGRDKVLVVKYANN
jgi:CUG-BP- and ETR3-like factor